VADKFAGPRGSFISDASTLRRALEALIAEQSLRLKPDVENLQALEERWLAKVAELQAKVGAVQKT
jgi:hypothetical protein